MLFRSCFVRCYMYPLVGGGPGGMEREGEAAKGPWPAIRRRTLADGWTPGTVRVRLRVRWHSGALGGFASTADRACGLGCAGWSLRARAGKRVQGRAGGCEPAGGGRLQLAKARAAGILFEQIVVGFM